MKGLLIGSSGASSLYLWSHPNAAGGWNQWAHVASNTGLGTGVGWTVCNCSAGAGIGALLGGGGTLAVQSFGTHDPTIKGGGHKRSGARSAKTLTNSWIGTLVLGRPIQRWALSQA